MKLIINTPAKALNKVYLKQSIKRDQVELFKSNLVRLFARIREEEHEEHLLKEKEVALVKGKA